MTRTFEPGLHLREHVSRLPVRRRVSKDGYVNLANNEFLHPALEPLFREALSHVSAETVRTYPHHPDLVRDLTEHYRLPPDSLLVSAGSDDAIKMVMDAVAATSGRLILQVPNYEQQYHLLRGLEIVKIPFEGAPRWRFTLAHFEAAFSSTPPSTVLISNPNGPTGFCFDLDQVRGLAERAWQHGHLLVVDEAYVPYNGFDHTPLISEFPNVVLIRSLSKSLGVAGLRAGFVAAPAPIAGYLARWNSQNPVSHITVVLVRFLLSRSAVIDSARDEIIACREWFVERMSVRFPQWTAVPSRANFVNFDTGNPFVPRQVVEHLQSRGILVRSMESVPALAQSVRFTIADRATMDRVLEALRDLPPSTQTPKQIGV